MFFEDEDWNHFSPLNLLRHTGQLRWGTKALLDSILESTAEAVEIGVWGRNELQEVTEASTHAPYNEEHSTSLLMVNCRARPGRELWNLTSKKSPFAAVSRDGLVAARVRGAWTKPGVITRSEVTRLCKEVPKLEVAPERLFHGYWDLVESNGLAIAEQAGRFGDSVALPSTTMVKGPPSSLRIHGSAEVEDHVSFNVMMGPIVVGKGASIESFSRVSGPCFIGSKTRVLSGLLRGGTSIFEGCKVGGEVENSIMMPHSNKAHFGYAGDSYVGEWVNLGAGSTLSNLKNTYGNVRTRAGGKRVDTGMLKLGPAIGDMSKVSIGALLFAGKQVGVGSHVTGLADTDIPSFTYYDGTRGRMIELLLSSVVETQRRTKERRGFTLGKTEEELINHAFRATAVERRRAGVRKGRIA